MSRRDLSKLHQPFAGKSVARNQLTFAYVIFIACMCIFFIYSDIYAREENTKILRRFCPFTRCALVTYGGTVDDVRLPQWRSSAEDGDIKRTCVIQDNGRNENQRPKVAVVPSSATRPCRFASPRRGRVSRNSCADERGR